MFTKNTSDLHLTLLVLFLQLFDFADKYRGKYDSSITVAQKYYRSISGYNVRNWARTWADLYLTL